MIFILNSQGQIWNLLYLRRKQSYYHDTKGKHTWWRHQIETFSALLPICAGNSPVPGEFPTQRPLTRSFHVFFDLRLNKRLSKQWWGWWFETLLGPLWRRRNVDWTLDLKCDHWIRPWPWHWPWNFKAKYGICISEPKMVRLPRNVLNSRSPMSSFSRKMSLSAFMLPGAALRRNCPNVTIVFDLGHDLERRGVGIYRIERGLQL